MIKCDTCPRCKDMYPGKLDRDGYHFHICGMGGTIVVEDALKSMTETERRRWEQEQKRKGEDIVCNKLQ